MRWIVVGTINVTNFFCIKINVRFHTKSALNISLKRILSSKVLLYEQKVFFKCKVYKYRYCRYWVFFSIILSCSRNWISDPQSHLPPFLCRIAQPRSTHSHYTHTHSHIRNTNACTYRCPRYGWVVISRVVMYYTLLVCVSYFRQRSHTYTRIIYKMNFPRFFMCVRCICACILKYTFIYSEDENASASTSVARMYTRVRYCARHRSRFVAASRSSTCNNYWACVVVCNFSHACIAYA